MNFLFFKLTPAEVERILEWYSTHDYEGHSTTGDRELANQLKRFNGEDIPLEDETTEAE